MRVSLVNFLLKFDFETKVKTFFTLLFNFNVNFANKLSEIWLNAKKRTSLGIFLKLKFREMTVPEF